MGIVDVNTINKNDVVKFIAPNRTLVDGTIRTVSPDCLGITIDIRQDAFIRLSKDQIIQLILVRETEAIKCSSVVLGCSQNDFEQAVVISIPKLILGIDRREYERFPIVMDIEYSPLPAEADYESLNTVESRYYRYFKKTYTVNISAGGVYFIVPKDQIDNKLALISLSLRDEKIITLCEKVRTDFIDNSKHNKVAYKYTDIQKRHRQLILDFISEKSQETKKGNILKSNRI